MELITNLPDDVLAILTGLGSILLFGLANTVFGVLDAGFTNFSWRKLLTGLLKMVGITLAIAFIVGAIELGTYGATKGNVQLEDTITTVEVVGIVFSAVMAYGVQAITKLKERLTGK